LPTKLFHGDLQFDNVIYGNDKKFYLIDWRQNFAGGDIGDVYYDLAKMYGGILMSYSSMKEKGWFSSWSCSYSGEEASFEHERSPALEKFQKFYEDWLVSNDFNLDKVKTLTALIFLNMAPLHEKEFGDLCFFKSKLMLS
jgi:thiamine kinase-like enzyme